MKYTILKENKKSIRVWVDYRGIQAEILVNKEYLKQNNQTLERALLDHCHAKLMAPKTTDVIGKSPVNTSNWGWRE